MIIQLHFQPEVSEHYDVKDILVDDDSWTGSIQYNFCIKKPEELLERVRAILMNEEDDKNIQMSLLPMELFGYSIIVLGKGNRVPYDILSKFRTVDLQAERDSFSSNEDRMESRALVDILQANINSELQIKIEKAYYDFFESIRNGGNLNEVLNWQEYSDIENAQEFFQQVSVLPNISQMSSILGGIRLGYENDYMFSQGLGYRNLVLMALLLNS